MKYLSLIFLLLCGCENRDSPPLFHAGDIVQLKTNHMKGIVTYVFESWNGYNVRLSDRSEVITFKEFELEKCD